MRTRQWISVYSQSCATITTVHFGTFSSHQKETPGTSVAVQWLRLQAPNVGGVGLIPGRGTKIPHAAWHGQINKYQ